MRNKKTCHQITISEMAPHVHTFLAGENKVQKISNWLSCWIKKSLEKGKINVGDFLPSKADLAFHMCVSKSTIQNVYRIVEDMGLIESKQRIGTYIIDKDNKTRKLTSKHEVVCCKLKKYILEKNLNIGHKLKSTAELAKEIDVSCSTLRTALNCLIEEGIIRCINKYFIIISNKFELNDLESKTLVIKISEYIKEYIDKNLKTGDKLPSSLEFAKKYNVSIKTIHDAIKKLQKDGIVKSRRGKYGTQVINYNSKTELYIYEKVKIEILEYIAKNCKIGDKLLPMRKFIKIFNTSTKTIKNALNELAEDGYVTFTRGRNGGTFVTDIPKTGGNSYTWLAINPDEFINYTN